MQYMYQSVLADHAWPVHAMVAVKAFGFVLDSLGEPHMREWISTHVRFGRVSKACAKVLPPENAAWHNKMLEDLEDEIRRDMDKNDDRNQEGLDWLARNADLFPDYFED